MEITYNQSPSLLDLSLEQKKHAQWLLSQMTLEEKIGQMVQVDTTWKQDIPQLIRQGRIGSILTIRDLPFINTLQKIAVQESRLGVPLLIGNDVIHGYKTIFPIPLALACTWEPEFIENVAEVIAREAIAAGTHWNFAPMVDICREPRWGRIAEGAGEDPWLGSQISRAWVRGFQKLPQSGSRRLAACVKHFAAYGAPEGGRDYNTVDMSEVRLRSEYLPPYQAAVEEGVASIMTSFNELNGVPATANTFLLQQILRDEWGFEGVVISDFDSIGELILHGFAEDHYQAAFQSASAGVDVDMMGDAYHFHLADQVEKNLISKEFIDEAALRVLELKEWIGLFENPYVDEQTVTTIWTDPKHQEAALDAAEKSIVLLKNENNLLPLTINNQKIALIGPLADQRQSLLGSWSCEGDPLVTETFLEALQENLPEDCQLTYTRGCEVEGGDVDFQGAITAAKQADLVILALGETDTMSGEAHSRAHIGLPGRQQDLADAICEIGKPVVAVIFSGRPLILNSIAKLVPSILMAWQGGSYAAQALVNILTGQADPSAKLTTTFPRCEGQIPVYYAHKRTTRPFDSDGTLQFNQAHKSIYLDESNLPLYPFGYGLTYTTFEYNDLVIEYPELKEQDSLKLSIKITNTGARTGTEIAQCYIRDMVGSVTRPVKELKDFKKITLLPGESQTVQFEIPVSRLRYWNAKGEYQVEAGEFRVWIGPNSQEGLQGTFWLVA